MFSPDGAADAVAAAGLPVRKPSGFRSELVDLAWLRVRQSAWDELSANAAYPNSFFGSHVIEAHAKAGLIGDNLRFLVVRQGSDLQALVPILPCGARLGFRRSHAVWTSRFLVVEATPLIGRFDVEAATDALADAASNIDGAVLWRWPLLSLESDVGQALRAALHRRRWAAEVLAPVERAVLNGGGDYDAYARAHLSPNRRKGLRRQRLRLAELGLLQHHSYTEGAGLSHALESFLTLEAQGWKGVRGTALASRPETAALARTAFQPSAGPVGARADLLTLDGAPIAVSLALVCGDTAYLLKTTFDERLRKYAPGVVLEDEIVRAFHQTRFAARLDSASVEGGVLESLYPGRIRMGELIFAADAGIAASALRSLVERERRFAQLHKGLKRIYWRAIDAKASWLGSLRRRWRNSDDGCALGRSSGVPADGG